MVHDPIFEMIFCASIEKKNGYIQRNSDCNKTSRDLLIYLMVRRIFELIPSDPRHEREVLEEYVWACIELYIEFSNLSFEWDIHFVNYYERRTIACMISKFVEHHRQYGGYIERKDLALEYKRFFLKGRPSVKHGTLCRFTTLGRRIVTIDRYIEKFYRSTVHRKDVKRTHV